MNEITAIEYINWNKVLKYWNIKIKDEAQKIKDSTLRIIWDEELENIKNMDINNLKILIEDILNWKSVF